MIDDDAGVARAVQRTLRSHEVVILSSGQKALDLLATGVHFDLILCDLMMPGLAGPDVHDALRKTRPELCERIVFMSGGIFTPRVEEFAQRTTCTVVAKPFDTVALRALVAERLAARRAPR